MVGLQLSSSLEQCYFTFLGTHLKSKSVINTLALMGYHGIIKIVPSINPNSKNKDVIV